MEVFKIFLTLLSFIAPQMVFQDFFEKVCNKYFFDSISNFVSSDLILKVQPIKDSKVFNQHKQYKQKFKVLKNYLPWFQVNDSMEVGFFGREDRVICVAGEMKEEWTLIIFVDFEYDGFYKLSALPIFWDEITDMIFDDLAENPDSEKHILFYVSYPIFCFKIKSTFSKFTLKNFSIIFNLFFNTQTLRSFRKT